MQWIACLRVSIYRAMAYSSYIILIPIRYSKRTTIQYSSRTRSVHLIALIIVMPLNKQFGSVLADKQSYNSVSMSRRNKCEMGHYEHCQTKIQLCSMIIIISCYKMYYTVN